MPNELKYRKTRKKRSQTRHEINTERVKTRITKGDTVRVMRGDDKGKEGVVQRVYLKKGRATVEGVNIVKRHRRARRPEEQSGIVEMAAPVHLSNLMLLAPGTGAPTRVRSKMTTDGTKERVAVKGGDAIPRSR